jgi:hypothetical protein
MPLNVWSKELRIKRKEIKKEHFFKIIKVTIPLNPPLHTKLFSMILLTCKGGQSPDETQVVIRNALPFG